MLNGIRRAFSFTRGRPTSKGRHRRPSTRFRPSAANSSAFADVSKAVPRQPRADASHRQWLTAEDNLLVRPYVVAWERRTRQHPRVVVAPHLPTDARSALLGVR